MAKYKVKGYSHVIKDNGKGYDNLYLSLELLNSSGNPANRDYRIFSDTRWPDLKVLTDTIVEGLSLAKANSANIELSDYQERKYLFLVLPDDNGKINMQVSAEKI
ncbi:hypothetical protein RAL92_10920 [Metapseudomonas otitidis]|uniref:hypothetical protein n=1 Tax=Metapseudomonas otitidis TaxID=319939 RepID=UPI0032162DFD